MTYLSAPDGSDAAAPVVAEPLGAVSDVVLLLNKGMSRSSTRCSERTPKRSAIMNAMMAHAVMIPFLMDFMASRRFDNFGGIRFAAMSNDVRG